MTKYKRITGKVFGGNATATGDDPQIAQFGSALANTFIGTTDPEVIQQLPAWGQGWIGAVTPDTQFPALPEMTGVMKVLSHQICTAEQEGVSSWDSGTIYYKTNFVSKNGKLYTSLTDENQGNDPETDTTNWQDFAPDAEWGKIQGDITNQADLQEQLTNKADNTLNNLTSKGKDNISNWASPSHNYQKLTMGADDTPYTAPSSGSFLMLAMSNKATNAPHRTILYLSNNNESEAKSPTRIATDVFYPDTQMSNIIRVKKGDIVKYIRINVVFTWYEYELGFYFIPDEGSEV